MTGFENSRAKMVCDGCFGGDAVAMKRYAVAYLAGGHKAVHPLGAAFRALLPGRARREFWTKALRQLDMYLEAAPMPRLGGYPTWTANAGGERAWRNWAKIKVGRCDERAEVWASKIHAAAQSPSKPQWREAINNAICNSDGRGHFSRLPLSLEGIEHTDPRWPSLEHLIDPANLSIAVEQRLFNDMKSILSIEEFRAVIGHLALVLAVPLKLLPDDWRPRRSFGMREQIDEPPLPDDG